MGIQIVKSTVFQILLVFCLVATAYAETTVSNPSELYSINSDEVIVDAADGTTTYQGNARVIVANLIIEAESIAITTVNGLPSRISATGSPISFSEQVPSKNINGTAREIVFDVRNLKLTLVDYSIADPSGNNMKGKKASFTLSP